MDAFSDYVQGVDFSKIAPSYLFIGLLNEFDNRFQTVGDCMFNELSWKQVFLLNCIVLFDAPPTIKDMAELLGTSHQNTKQILDKLEKRSYVELVRDNSDRRKQRIVLTQKTLELRERFDKPSESFMRRLFTDISPAEFETTISVFTRLHGRLKQIQEEMKCRQ